MRGLVLMVQAFSIASPNNRGASRRPSGRPPLIDVASQIEKIFTSHSLPDALDAIRMLGRLDKRQPFDFERSSSSSIRKVEGLFSRSLANSVMDKVEELEMSTEADSVDGQPSYHMSLVANGEKMDSDGIGNLLSLVDEAVYGDLLPIAREMMDNDKIIVSDVFLRRYGSYEINGLGRRSGIMGHYDCYSVVTAVVALDDVSAQGSNGLFTIELDEENDKSCHISCRRFFPLEIGDAVMHDWKTLHGVDVEPNKDRTSLVVWFSVEGQQRETVPNWISSGKIGDFVKGIASESAHSYIGETHPHDLYISSAALGNPFAMNRLGGLLEEEALSPERVAIVGDLLKELKGLPRCCLNGDEDCCTSLARRAWYQSALNGMAMALSSLGDEIMGDILWGEDVENGNVEKVDDMLIFAAKSIGLAAQQGHPEAVNCAKEILASKNTFLTSEECGKRIRSIEQVAEILKACISTI
mmetsp:Transcript_22940/g.44754  ORF Transcript_22940/g.44754 Transcript_22940/m.44754 type:complete len:469 (+) Transcript_22940:75-1481(+)